VNYLSDSDPPSRMFGDYGVIQSRSETGRQFPPIESLGVAGGKQAGDSVWIRARVAGVRAKGGSAFLVLRAADGSYATVQVPPPPRRIPHTLPLANNTTKESKC
jgi:hypothetical protein